MQLQIKVLGGREFYPTISDNGSILDVKCEIEKLNGTPVLLQKLVFKGKTLANDKKLTDCGVTEFSKLHLVVKKKEAESSKLSGATITPKYTEEDFWITLEKVLLKQYDSEVVDKIVRQYRMDYKQMLMTMSLDDIERFATRSLRS